MKTVGVVAHMWYSLLHIGSIKKTSEKDQEIPKSHTADQPMAP